MVASLCTLSHLVTYLGRVDTDVDDVYKAEQEADPVEFVQDSVLMEQAMARLDHIFVPQIAHPVPVFVYEMRVLQRAPLGTT